MGPKGLSDSSGGTEPLFLPLPLNSSSSEFQNGFSMATFSRMQGVGIKEGEGPFLT